LIPLPPLLHETASAKFWLHYQANTSCECEHVLAHQTAPADHHHHFGTILCVEVSFNHDSSGRMMNRHDRMGRIRARQMFADGLINLADQIWVVSHVFASKLLILYAWLHSTTLMFVKESDEGVA
jgi:hypothetical protein